MSGPASSIDRADNPESVDPLDASVNAAIEACDGDPRATVRALILANAFLEEELERTRAMLSRGYVRGRAGRSRGAP
ncbi:hypothetical protein SAMN05519104_6933 [Rhizobiales bacterium GAS188]|nr:hypothetical protein SAMN05519104_6933 [Rhizobiales bacterium GAS188]